MPSSGCQKSALRSEEHTSELQSHDNLVCRLLLAKNSDYRVVRTGTPVGPAVWPMGGAVRRRATAGGVVGKAASHRERQRGRVARASFFMRGGASRAPSPLPPHPPFRS